MHTERQEFLGLTKRLRILFRQILFAPVWGPVIFALFCLCLRRGKKNTVTFADAPPPSLPSVTLADTPSLPSVTLLIHPATLKKVTSFMHGPLSKIGILKDLPGGGGGCCYATLNLPFKIIKCGIFPIYKSCKTSFFKHGQKLVFLHKKELHFLCETRKIGSPVSQKRVSCTKTGEFHVKL